MTGGSVLKKSQVVSDIKYNNDTNFIGGINPLTSERGAEGFFIIIFFEYLKQFCDVLISR